MRKKLFLFLLFCPFLPDSLYAQTPVDSLFETARELAYDKQYNESRAILFPLADEFPEYNDLHLFIGRTYVWENDYESAKKWIQPILDKRPPIEEAHFLALDLYLYEKSQVSLKRQIDTASFYYPEKKAKIMLYEARLYLALGNQNRAWRIAQKIKKNEPEIGDSILQIVNRELDYTLVGATYNHTWYGDVFERSDYQLEGIRRAAWGAAVVRYAMATRDNFTPTHLGEVEFYPVINKNWYLYGGIGFASDGPLFPRFRGGIEPYYVTDNSWEFSAGYRHLAFFQNPVNLITASAGKYFQNKWIAFRGFYGPQKDAAASISAEATGRVFLSDPFHFVELRLGYGFSPENQIIDNELANLLLSESYRVSAAWQQWLNRRFLLRLAVNYEFLDEEIRNTPIWMMNIGLFYRFQKKQGR